MSSLPAGGRRGYLWKLSERKVLSRPSWKCKYFVLAGDKLYYCSSSRDMVTGVVNLAQVVECVEAGQEDMKRTRSTNVFILRLSGGQHPEMVYFSAETLTEMKAWMMDIQMAIDRNNSSSIYSIIPEVLPKSINTPSNFRGSGGSSGVLGLDEDGDHNLTYSYSSDEDDVDDNQRHVSRSPRTPRSVDTCLRRRVLDRSVVSHIDSSAEDVSTYNTIPRSSNRKNSEFRSYKRPSPLRKYHRSDTTGRYSSVIPKLDSKIQNSNRSVGNQTNEKPESFQCLDKAMKELEHNSENLTKCILTSGDVPEAIQDKLDNISNIICNLQSQSSQIIQVS